MSDNPIAPTVLQSLTLTSTTSTALVVGGAIGAVTGTGGIQAGPIVSSSSVSDSVGTMATIRAGGIGIASQAALDLITAASATQFARTAAGAALQAPRINAAANGWEFYNPLMELVHEGSGTNSTAGATNVDTYALASTLTIKDTLLIYVRHRNTGNAANIVPLLYNDTDSVSVATLSTANNNYYVDSAFIGAQSTTRIGATSTVFGTGLLAAVRSTFTTAWTGAWTIALRHGGLTAPDTWEWAWTIYRIPGQ